MDVRATVTLEPLNASDCDEVARWNEGKDSDFLTQWAGNKVYKHPLTARQVAVRLSELNTRMYKVIYDGGMVGCIELYAIDRQARSARVCRFLLRDDRAGRGIGKAALRELVRIAFQELGLERLTLGVFVTNVSAIRCYEAVGFRVLKHNYGDTARWNSFTMELRADEFRI